MRYITNQLGWTRDAWSMNSWIDGQGNSLDSKFCFGANHDWQPPSGKTSLFASEPLTVEMAQAWLNRDQFTSLVSGHASWSPFLTETLGLEIPCFQKSDDQKTFQLAKGDVVLRAGFACTSKLPDCWSRSFIEELPGNELVQLLKEQPDLIRFYLHFIMDAPTHSPVHYDSGL